jgi:hypothetical protein
MNATGERDRSESRRLMDPNPPTRRRNAMNRFVLTTRATRDVSGVSPLAARLAIGAAVATLVLLASLHVLSPEFDPSWRMVSEYANGRYGWVLSLLFAAWGVSSGALAVALRSEATTIRFRIGLAALALAGVGQAMAAIFDINHDTLHGIAGALGMLGLPLAAMLISAHLGRTAPRSAARRTLRWTANLTWVSLVVLAATFVLMTATFVQVAGSLPAQPPPVLPAGVIGLVGWANRLLVVLDCAWTIAVAGVAIERHRREISPPRADSGRPYQTAELLSAR